MLLRVHIEDGAPLAGNVKGTERNVRGRIGNWV